ncbi:MAG: glycosyltransferase [Paludibacteraceae bacterium]|nr:glycosyltransferase [Paludibacteraceae bacterium]
MDSKLCSIIVPIYNAAPFLAQCLTSIKMQTYQDLQVILIDDGSTDESSKIAQSFVDADARFSLIHQTNQGQGAARNRGLEKATGEYLIFVDADDYLDNDFIAQHLAAIENADYVQSGYRRVNIEGNILEQKLPRHRYQFTSPCMRLYRTSWLKENALCFPTDMIYEDVIFSLSLWGTQPKIQFIHYIGYNYTCNPHSTTSKFNVLAQKQLFNIIRYSNVPRWLKLLTILRLKIHFCKSSSL